MLLENNLFQKSHRKTRDAILRSLVQSSLGSFSVVPLPKMHPSLKAPPPLAGRTLMLWSHKTDVETIDCEKTMDVRSRLLVFWDVWFGKIMLKMVLDWFLRDNGGELVNWGAGSKNCSPEIVF